MLLLSTVNNRPICYDWFALFWSDTAFNCLPINSFFANIVYDDDDKLL